MPHWVDSMFLYSLIWAFGSILTEEAKKEFEAHLRKVFHEKKLKDKDLEDRRIEELERGQNDTEYS